MSPSTIYAQSAWNHLDAARKMKAESAWCGQDAAIAIHVEVARRAMREHVRAVAVNIPVAMPAREARMALHLLGWSQEGAADRLGVSHRMMRRYLAAGGVLPPTVAELLRCIVERHTTTS